MGRKSSTFKLLTRISKELPLLTMPQLQTLLLLTTKLIQTKVAYERSILGEGKTVVHSVTHLETSDAIGGE